MIKAFLNNEDIPDLLLQKCLTFHWKKLLENNVARKNS
jgi:hypothetical protein